MEFNLRELTKLALLSRCLGCASGLGLSMHSCQLDHEDSGMADGTEPQLCFSLPPPPVLVVFWCLHCGPPPPLLGGGPWRDNELGVVGPGWG